MSFPYGIRNRNDLQGGLQPILKNCMRQPTVKYVIFCHPYADSGDITIQETEGRRIQGADIDDL